MSAAAEFARALVVDDLADVRAWLARRWARPFPASKWTPSQAWPRRWRGSKPPPQIALVDLGLPDGSGTQLIEALQKRGAGTLCIVATVFDDDAHLFPRLACGRAGLCAEGPRPRCAGRHAARHRQWQLPLS